MACLEPVDAQPSQKNHDNDHERVGEEPDATAEDNKIQILKTSI